MDNNNYLMIFLHNQCKVFAKDNEKTSDEHISSCINEIFYKIYKVSKSLWFDTTQLYEYIVS